MAAIWTPLPSTDRGVGIQGSASAISGSAIPPITWLDVMKGETIINGTISTIWDSDPVRCVSVSHSSAPALPAGISVADNPGIGGIIVSGNTNATLITSIHNEYTLTTPSTNNKGIISSNTLPVNSILTHYTPSSEKYIDYTVTVTVQWEHGEDRNVDSDTKSWIIRVWNNWIAEKNDVLGIVD